MANKTCSRCKKSRPLTEYPISLRDGQSPHCRSCQRVYKSNWRARNRESLRGYQVKRKYGLDQDSYKFLCTLQKDLCAICDQPETVRNHLGGVKNLAVDHCHDTGNVRALLCNSCNHGLGKFKENINILTSAIIYLKGFKHE